MANVKITLHMEIDDELVDELKQIVDHKINYDGLPEINDIYNCSMEVEK